MAHHEATENLEKLGGFLNRSEREETYTKIFSAEQLQTFTSDFSIHLGSSSFGDVYQGIYNGEKVAVKVLKEEQLADNTKEEQFIAEVSSLGKPHHKNLVKLYGFCFQPKMKALVYEFMEMGSLDKVLHGKRSIKWETLCNIAIGTAKGLAYLHMDCQPSITHYALKPSNILLDSNYYPKIGDFGLAKLLKMHVTHVRTRTRVRGTPYYCAPERYIPYLTVNYKCDVYSYGMMLFDIVSMGKYQHQQGQDWFPSTVWDKYEKGKLEEVMADCIEEKDKDMAKRILMIALNCIDFSASHRPSMSDVVRLLEGTKYLQLPPKCFLSSPPEASSSIVVPSKRNLELESVFVEEIITPHGEKEKEMDGYIIVEIQFKSLGPWGGLGGSEWDDGVFPGILQIEITRDRREICSIEIEYCRNDGMSVGWSNKHGHNTGQQTDKIVFDYPSEYLMGITGFVHGNGTLNLVAVRSISFITNKKIHGPYGVNLIAKLKGDPFTSGKLGKVVGFHGRSGLWLDAIGVHMEPMEDSNN